MGFTPDTSLGPGNKVLLQKLGMLQVSSSAREGGMAIMVQGYAFLLLLFHWLGLVCPPEHLSFNKA